MKTAQWLGKIKRGLQKPPRVIVRRVYQLISAEIARVTVRGRVRRVSIEYLLHRIGAKNLAECWIYLSKQPYPAYFPRQRQGDLETYCPGHTEDILHLADQALGHCVNLLGSGWIQLGKDIDWLKDYKTGFSWPSQYCRDIDYNNKDRPSDVKFPWELSRFQWLIPVGQAYLLTGDERYAAHVKTVISDWVAKNPVAMTVNWACTMEVALRIMSLTWFFHVFHQSGAWQDSTFQQQFLLSLYWHGKFTAANLEYSDINGNHFTADAAGLVFAGLFFSQGKEPTKWQTLGWQLLEKELPLQVKADGVDYEASLAYHRLVLELFFLPALYREIRGLSIETSYQDRIIAMAEFVAAYSRADGTPPLWGDADDARALPFAHQAINDHRYLIGWVGVHWDQPSLMQRFTGPMAEIYWSLGENAVKRLTAAMKTNETRVSQAFAESGYFIMQSQDDHIFIDCAEVGLAGRGGHGHNDCLAFTAVLAGEELISDCGAFVYTASYEDRNLFRSTTFHNTPGINNVEINRFLGPDYLWNLHYDAKPRVITWETSSELSVFVGSHGGYQRLDPPLQLMRLIAHEPLSHRLLIYDHFVGAGEYDFRIPLHLAPQVMVLGRTDDSVILGSGNKQFIVTFSAGGEWGLSIEPTRISPSYGVEIPSQQLVWSRRGKADVGLRVVIELA